MLDVGTSSPSLSIHFVLNTSKFGIAVCVYQTIPQDLDLRTHFPRAQWDLNPQIQLSRLTHGTEALGGASVILVLGVLPV